MAEIKIEKKKPVWPWILLAVVLIGIIYFIYASQEDDDYTDDADINEIENTNGVMESDSNSYDSGTTYADSYTPTRELSEVMKDSTRFGTDSAYTNKALYELAERTLALAKNHSLQPSSAISDLEEYTTTTANSTINNASENFKTVSTDITEVIETLQSNHAPRLHQKVEELKDIASQINTATELSKQQNTVQAYVRKTHELLNYLNI